MSIALHAITFDCADPNALAGFWAAFLDRPADPVEVPGFVTIGMKEGHPFYVFQKMDDTSTGLNRVHVDFSTPDLPGQTRRLLELGATIVAEVAENGIQFTTFADPEGNKFDLAAE